MQIRFGECLIYARLVGSESATALQEQRDPLKRRTFRHDMRLSELRRTMSGLIRHVGMQQQGAHGWQLSHSIRVKAGNDASNPPIIGSSRAESPAPGCKLGLLLEDQADAPIAGSLRSALSDRRGRRHGQL